MQASSVENSLFSGPIEVSFDGGNGVQAVLFSSTFRIGRATECDVRLSNAYVSRLHAKVTPEPGGWLVTDLGSGNGLYWNGNRVQTVSITSSETVRLGIEGPELFFRVQTQSKPEGAPPRPFVGSEFVRIIPPEPAIPQTTHAGSESLRSVAPHSDVPQPRPYAGSAYVQSMPPDPVVAPRQPYFGAESGAGRAPEPVVSKPTGYAGSESVKGPQPQDMEEYVKRYFREPVAGEVVGEHTGYIRRAFTQIQTQQKKTHSRQKRMLFGVIAGLTVVGLLISAYAIRLQRQARHQRELARNLFYAMKSLDVEIAAAEQTALTADKVNGLLAVNKFEARRRELQTNYDQFLSTLHIYDPKSSEQHRLILRVARIFGEGELDMPPQFEAEVLRYIKMWQSTGRFARGIQTARDKGYTRTIPEALLNRGLPVQFFYLAMQESDFDSYRSGPLTRKGYAKGMWQFIPETAVKYGLHLGPLVDLQRPDPGDERIQVDKATDAATRYIQMLYSTDAQASGLLVMACYNWGENQVLPLVRSLPPNPRERNFWRLLADHRDQIPNETYDYVFYITSAAVIGENPRLFGFNFDNPLESSH